MSNIWKLQIYKDFNMIVDDILVSSSPEIQIHRSWPQICLATFPVLSSRELSEFSTPRKMNEVELIVKTQQPNIREFTWHLETGRSINKNRFLHVYIDLRKLNCNSCGILAARWFIHYLENRSNGLKCSWSYHHCWPDHSNSREHLIMFWSTAK